MPAYSADVKNWSDTPENTVTKLKRPSQVGRAKQSCGGEAELK